MPVSGGSHAKTLPPDWGPELDFWVPDGEPNIEIPWPDDFEVCGVPDYEPAALVKPNEPKRHGRTYMAWPMYAIDDSTLAIETFCSVLERMSPAAFERWCALPDRFLRVSAGDTEMDWSNIGHTGLSIPGPTILRIRRLMLRLQITLCPNASVRILSGF